MRLLIWFCLRLGRRPARWLLSVVVLHYVVLSSKTRRASSAYLSRAGIEASWGNIYRHVWCFATVALDRVFFVAGEYKPFAIELHGHEHLLELRRRECGALLLGGHVGSFEALRAASEVHGMPIAAVGDFSNARRINALLDELGDNSLRLVHVDPGGGFLLKLRELLEAGTIVAMLVDRSVGGACAKVTLFGGEVSLSVAPYALASTLRCPIYTTCGLFSEPNRYDLYCEPFAELTPVPRAERDAVFQHHAQRFATKVEQYARLAPFNWFNFYDYWDDSAH